MPNTQDEWLWWLFSVVVVSLLMNLIAAAIYPRIEKRLAERSAKRRALLQQKEDEFHQEVKALREDKTKFTNKKIDMVIISLRMIACAVIWIFFSTSLEELSRSSESFSSFTLAALLIFSVTATILRFLLLIIVLFDLNKLRRVDRLLQSAEKDIRPNLLEYQPND